MTRQKVLRQQLMAAGIVVVVLAILIGINTYTRTFRHQVHLGKIVSASFSVGGPPAFVWTDPKDLERIQAALPWWQAGSGYAPYSHSHQSMTLMLMDDKQRQLFLALPGDESALVLLNPRPPDYPTGNSWNMPKLLGVIGEIGLRELAKSKSPAEPMSSGQFQYWADTYGTKAKA